jgi:hypothetical protein
MTRIIEIGARGQLVVYIENGAVRVNNATTCTLVIDGKLVNPGETV